MSYGLDFFVFKNEVPTRRAAMSKELRGGKALSEVSHSPFARSKANIAIFKRELRNKSGTLFLLAVWPGHGNCVLRRRGGKIYPHGDIKEIGIPCVVKPIMSSSGHGQSTVKSEADIEPAWTESQMGGRAGAGRVIVEGFVHFDYEITLLTVRHAGGTTFLKPIGHHQVDGDYRESWQPQAMTDAALAQAENIAKKVTDALGGYGIFGVEMFVEGDHVIFSEVSPRPHDTGMVTMISQDLSEFALHARAVLGLPIPEVRFFGASASKAIVVEGDATEVVFSGVEEALAIPGVQVRFFGKPEVHGHRRYGVVLATDENTEKAVAKAIKAFNCIKVENKDLHTI